MKPITATLALLVAATLSAQDAAPKQDVKKLISTADASFSSQDWSAAARDYGKLVEIDPENGTAWHRLGFSLHALGRLDEAMPAHHKATKFPAVAATATYNIACVHALRGEKDLAFQWLEKAAKAGFARADHIASDPDMDSLRADPRYAKMIEKLSEHAAAPTAYVATTPRASTRLSFWGGQGSPGQVAIDHGQPTWKAEYASAIDAEKHIGRRWRLGSDFWTTLDTNVPLTLGGAKVAPGLYYLTVAQKGKGEFVLTLLDAADVRKQKLDAYLAHLTKGGIDVALEHAVSETSAERLAISIGDVDGTEGELAIAFGPHRLSAPIAVHLD